jgi:cytochrome c biogenesis protein CcmG/thiol:disulfide interchange protein DsbE
MKKVLKITALLLLASMALAGGLFAGCTSSGPEIGKLAPDFTLTGLDGQAVSLSDLRGQPVLLNFWASWCGPCSMEMPFLQGVYEKWSGKGLVLLAINMQEDPMEVKGFIENAGYTFPVLLTTGNDVPLAYNIRGIPATFFIDTDGVIRDIKIGAFFTPGEIESKLVKIMP